MKKSFLLAVACLLITATSFGQKDETLFGRNGLRITGAWGGSAWNLSTLGGEGEYAVFTGGYGGVEFNKNFFIGWGGQTLINDVRYDQFDNDSYEMDYNGLILGYGIKSHRVIHPQFMMMLGGGTVDVQNVGRDNFLTVMPSAGVELNVFRWFRVNLQGGYRMVSNTSLAGISDADLSDFYGEVKFKFGWSWGRGR